MYLLLISDLLEVVLVVALDLESLVVDQDHEVDQDHGNLAVVVALEVVQALESLAVVHALAVAQHHINQAQEVAPGKNQTLIKHIDLY